MVSINAGLALDWTRSPRANDAVAQFAKIAEVGIFGFFPLTKAGRTGTVIADASALLSDIEDGIKESSIYQGGTEIESDFSVSRSGNLLEIQAVCTIGKGKVSSNFANAYASLLERLCNDQTRFVGVTALGIRGLKMKRIRPPRQYGMIDVDAVVDLITTDAASDLAAKMQHLELPAGTKRLNLPSCTIINWAPNLSFDDEDAVRSCLESKQRWLFENIPAPIADGWNKDGDSIFQMGSVTLQLGLSLYDPSSAIGFVTIHSAEPDADRDDKIAAVSAMLTRGRLEGSDLRLEDAGIISSDRNTAIKLHKKYANSQIRWFLYASDKEIFNPFPEGSWQS